MLRPKRTLLHFSGALVIILSAVSAPGWEQSNDRDFAGSRNLGIRLYGNTLTMSLEQDGSFDINDGSDLTAIRSAFTTINGISTSDATVLEGPTNDLSSTIDSEAGYSWSDEKNKIYFFNVDSDNSFDALAASAVYYDQFTGLILGSQGWPNRGGCDIAVNDLDYNWSTATPGDPTQLLPDNTYDIQSVITHEMMHCFGFEHTAVVGSFDPATGLEVGGFTNGNYSYQATLYPYASPDIQGRTLKADDIAAFSDVYPSAGASSSLGQISGRILRPDGSGVKGAHVVAVPAGDPTHPLVGRLSGIEADRDPGGYRMTGLAPGDYYVRVEPLTGTTNPYLEANTEFLGFDTTFTPEFYSGAGETAVDVTIAVSDAASVTVTAGATVHDVDIILNSEAVGAALNPLPALPWRLAFVAIEGGASPPAQTFTVKNVGTGSPDWYITGLPSWLTVSPLSGVLTPDGDVVSITPKLQGVAAGTYRAKLAITGVGAQNSSQAVSVILVVGPGANAIRTVCASGCGYTTMQGAIDASTSGDIVSVGAGHYLESIVMKDGVKMVGAGADQTVIDAGGNGIVVIGASNSLLDGFTVTGGSNSSVYEAGYWGAGVKFKNFTNAAISHNVVKYNEIPEQGAYGAGILATGTGNSVLDNVVRLNTAGYYDAFASTAAGGDGGGIYGPDDQGRIAGNRIVDNLAGSGGGIYLGLNGTANAAATDNVISRNEVTSFGGNPGGGITIALYSANSTAQITNNVIVDNFNGFLPCNLSGIEESLSPKSLVTNNIIWGHRYWTGAEYCAYECEYCQAVNYSTVDGGYTGTGNTNADPLFRDRANYDYHLLSGSPAIDAGSNTAPSISSYALDGLPRILDGNNDGAAVADMGAYEFGSLPPLPTATLSPRGGLSFEPRPLANPSPANALTITNSGIVALTIAHIAIAGGNAGDFAESHNCPISPSALAAGSFCTVNVTFAPTAPGPRKTALLVSSDAPGSPHRIILTGQGSAVSLSPTDWNFGSLPAQASSAPKVITLTNLGGTPIHVWSSSVSGVHAEDFSRTGNCPAPPATLAGGNSCTFSVTFTPKAAGAHTAPFAISHDGGASPASVSLTGTGTSVLQTQSVNPQVVVVPLLSPAVVQASDDAPPAARDKRKTKTAKKHSEPQ